MPGISPSRSFLDISRLIRKDQICRYLAEVVNTSYGVLCFLGTFDGVGDVSR